MADGPPISEHDREILERGLRILARVIARAYLREHSMINGHDGDGETPGRLQDAHEDGFGNGGKADKRVNHRMIRKARRGGASRQR